ncbi:MAG: tetratricopeptide repeat protein [Myxococcus sp.]|nr:tetratricopeptide repeat protein [Myxococcus sp.]
MAWARVVVVVTLAVGALALAQSPADQAAAVYEQGKALYDAKDYPGALTKFDEAAALEPTRARWHYNRGLALKKLKRDDDARAAFERSRQLEPDYKRAEIDQKLSELRSSAASSPDSSSNDFTIIIIGAVIALLGLLSVGGVLWKVGKALLGLFVTFDARPEAGAPKKRAAVNNPPQALDALSRRLPRTAEALARVEHGLSKGEDPVARGHADRAATNLASVRRGLAAATRNERPVAELSAALDRAQEAAELGQQRLVALHGEQVRHVRGPRAGCFFCARALPTAKAGEPVQLRAAAGLTTVAACPTCARRVAAGTPPPVLMVDGDRRRHWSEVDDLDPYLEAHAPRASAVEVPAWNVMNAGAALNPLATFAGGAVLGALGAAAVGRVLDLESLKQSDLASLAAQASAKAATSKRSTEYSDHS